MEFSFIKFLDYFAYFLIFAGVLIFVSKFIFKTQKKWLGILLICFGVFTIFGGIILFSGSYLVQKKSGVGNINNQAQDFSFQTATDDNPKKLSDFKGKYVLLNFWATWCSPCLEEMPDLSEISEKYRDRGLVVLAISDEDGETVRSFLERHDYKFETGFLNIESADNLPEIFKNTVGRPTSILIDKDGTVKSVIVGGSTKETFERSLSEFLNLN